MDSRSSASRVAASFRDPSGFVFVRDGVIYRQVNHAYREHYDRLMQSGLYHALSEAGQLLPHVEVGTTLAMTTEAYQVIRPTAIPFISYPYEWSFSQLKQAALLTLAIQTRALGHNLSLKDSSAYNIQFMGPRPVLIDTLSFEPYVEGRPWVAYRQFCQHFLAPLALMSKADVRLQQLLRVYLDGVPLDLTSKLLPFSTRLNFGLLSHIHLHAQAQRRYAGADTASRSRRMSQLSFLGLIDNLRSTVEKLRWQPSGTAWVDYYDDTNYSPTAFEDKQRLVANMLDKVLAGRELVWDLGANTGVFSRLAGQRGASTIAFDVDPGAVERNYLASKDRGETQLLPLVLDLTNPSPALGWENRERRSLLERGPADVVLALALIHHLAISNNLPLARIAEFFGRAGRHLIIEFVPKSDSQVQRLLMSRVDIFDHYQPAEFEREFATWFSIEEKAPVPGTERVLYRMTSRGST